MVDPRNNSSGTIYRYFRRTSQYGRFSASNMPFVLIDLFQKNQLVWQQGFEIKPAVVAKDNFRRTSQYGRGRITKYGAISLKISEELVSMVDRVLTALQEVCLFLFQKNQLVWQVIESSPIRSLTAYFRRTSQYGRQPSVENGDVATYYFRRTSQYGSFLLILFTLLFLDYFRRTSQYGSRNRAATISTACL